MIDPIVETTNTKQSEEILEQVLLITFLDETADNILNGPQGFVTSLYVSRPFGSRLT